MSLRNRALGAMLAGLLGLTGCLPLGLLTAGDTAATVKIGYMNPLTGDDATYGQNYADACQLAIDHINAAGGVNGQKLELLKGNDQGSGEIGVPVARSLVNQGIVAMVGPGYSGVMKPVLKDVLIPAGVPSIGHSAQDPSLAEPALKAGNNNFRIVTSEDQDALAFSKYFKGEKHSKVVVLSRDNPENKPFAEEFARLVKADGVDAKLIVYDDVDNPNYAAIKAQIPDGTTAIVLAANPGDGKSILDDWYASGQHKDIGWYFYVFIWGFVPDATEKKFLEGRRGIGPSYRDDVHLNAFLGQFKKYSKVEYVGGAETTYDIVMMLALAMAKGKANTREAVKDNFISISREGTKNTGWGVEGYKDALAKLASEGKVHYIGVAGDHALGDNGELLKPVSQIWEWKDGQTPFVDGLVY